MDRTQAFAEYGQILRELDDSLTGGFRRQYDEVDISPPPMSKALPDQRTGGGFQSVDPETQAVETLQTSLPGPEAEAPPQLRVDQSPAAPVPRVEAPPDNISEGGVAMGPELSAIAAEVSNCKNCNLYLLREHTVPGIGIPGATLMIVTQPPTDMAGSLSSPLAAYEHEYMEKWLTALGLNSQRDVFITPSVKCRTPGGRPPQVDEFNSCNGYLRRQYKAVRPRAVLALGAAACGALTGNPADFPSLVGRDWTWGAVPALVLWTPAEVLANPGRLRKPVWDALLRLKAGWNAIPGTQL